ncbi:MAG: hypothetical protein WBD09_07955 [Halobacteriota archaeon]
MAMQGIANESEAEPEPPDSLNGISIALGLGRRKGISISMRKGKSPCGQKKVGRGRHEYEYEEENKRTAKDPNISSQLLRLIQASAPLAAILFFHRSSGWNWVEFDDRYAATASWSHDSYSTCNCHAW